METLQILAGLVFIYLLLSLVCTALNELIAQFLNLRGKTLRTGIRTLIEGPETRGLFQRLGNRFPKGTKAAAGPSAVDTFYDHPLVAGLRPTSLLKGSRLPSYIPADIFAVALLGLLPSPEGGPPKSIQSIREGAQKLPPQLGKALTVLIDQAGDNVQKLQLSISKWFSDAMERVSGVYKRRTQIIILLLGLGTTALLNADTIRIWRTLSKDSTVRAAVLSAAEAYSKQPSELSSAIARADSALGRIDAIAAYGVPLGWHGSKFDWSMLPGWLITALAISLGAPFWFDVLNKVMNVRSAGRAPEEMPKPPEALPPPRGP